jgi:hypothetical protein
MCPPDHVAKHGQQAAQWHPNRAGQYQATGNRSSHLENVTVATIDGTQSESGNDGEGWNYNYKTAGGNVDR